jgi:hypothetical protein
VQCTGWEWTQSGSRDQFPVMSLDFSVTYFLPTVPWPWGRLSPEWKWVPGAFLGVKGVGAWGWQPHHLHVPNVMKSGSLNLLELSGPHRAFYETPLPLLLRDIILWALWLWPTKKKKAKRHISCVFHAECTGY